MPLLGLLLVAGAMGRAADASSEPVPAGHVTAVRFWSLGDTTRIAIEVSSEFRFKSERLTNPDRLYFDVLGATPEMARRTMQIIHVDDKIIKQIRVAETQPGVTRVVIDLQQAVTMSTSQLNNPSRLMIEVKASASTPSESKSIDVTSEAKPITPIPSSRPVDRPVKIDAPAITVTKQADAAPSVPVKNVTAKAAARTIEITPSVAKESKPLETKPLETKKVSDARPVQITSASAAMPGTNRVTRPVEDRPASVPENPVPNTLANSASNASVDSVQKSAEKTAESTANLIASLPPEPLGVEPPATPEDVQHERPRIDVRQVLPAKRGSSEDSSLTRALGLKLSRIVIDPGHGGHDVGTHGPSGYLEKDLVLDVSRRLAALIQERMSAEVVLTRSEDVYVGLEERTRIANEHKADLFLSIHANSSPYRSAAGVETYVLNFTTSKTAMELASRENASSDLGIHDLQDVLQKIALRDKIDESHEFAARLQTSLAVLSTRSNDAARNRGVKKAPFVVLIGANMPSVLAEIGFLTNASDEALLRKPEHRQKIAEALYKGISSYAGTLSQVVAAKQN